MNRQANVTIDESDIVRLLSDRGVPWAPVFRTDDRVLEVESFLRFASRHGMPTDALEPATDDFVRRHGGRREGSIDPWSWIPNLLRRLAGRRPRPSEQLWFLPRGASEDG